MPFEELNISLYHNCLNWLPTFLSQGVITSWPVCQMYDSPHSFNIEFMKLHHGLLYFLKRQKVWDDNLMLIEIGNLPSSP